MRFLCGAGSLILLLMGPSPIQAGDAKKPLSPQAIQFFETKVRPVLADHCFKCHGDVKRPKGGLRLDSLSGMLGGGDQGPAIIAGEPGKSLLIKAITYEDKELKMPPAKKLNREQIAALSDWVKMGAPWPGGNNTAVPVAKIDGQVTAKDREHWSFQPVKRPETPAVKNQQWVANPIDAFILAGLEAKGLKPNPPASRLALVRRVYYDVTGLPPTPAEIESFLADNSPQAYEKLVDELLDSPHYGEKWARHWLDLVRYAETTSYERDNPMPNAWRFRDYVIRSFNLDKPYDRFVREQLAGDELAPGDADALIATGYYRLGIWDDEPSDPLQARYDGLDDIVATTGQVFLGLTLDCARCHNHKIDPIPQKDYYGMLAFFQNINPYAGGRSTDLKPLLPPAQKLAYEQRVKELDKRREQIQTEIKGLEKVFLSVYEKTHSEKEVPDVAALIAADGPRLLGAQLTAEYKKLKKSLASLKKLNPAVDMALCVSEAGANSPATHILVRGNPHVPGEQVEPGFPQVISHGNPVLPKPTPEAKSSGRRLVLADWIVSKENPLTARVMVNRLWQYHFGRGIVRSSNDFGFQGTRPTHPELLDWLASELMTQEWRFKPLHRLILTSQAYRMSSAGNAAALAADPANDHFWRFDMRRLSAEEVRDSILAVSGNLNLKMYGPGVYPEIPAEVLAGQSVPGRGWEKSPPEEQARRSVYIHVKRSLLYPILESFDLAETDRSTPVRFSTTQPTQALGMLNGAFLNKQSGIFAERLRRDAGQDVATQVRRALHLATARQPSEADIRRGVDLIQNLQTQDGATAAAALQAFCLVVLNLNEFVYLD
jgi:hypothetical protein